VQIEWTAPDPGTALLVEKTTGRAVVTKSLGNRGDMFEFNGATEVDGQVLKTTLGTAATNVQLILYFVPAQSSSS
jgi:hypothetical protein